MKNKKGFTLVELLAVIVVVAIIAIIAVPSIMKTLNATKQGISNYEKKNIVDASERLVMEVVNCEIGTETAGVLNIQQQTNKCSAAKNIVFNSNGFKLQVSSLREHKYLEDTKSRCTGEITVNVDSNYKVTVDTSKVTCGS